MDVKEIDILGDDIHRHWYYRAKAKALARALQGHSPVEILDVGAGSGFFSKSLLSTTAARRAVCVDPAYTSERDEFVRDKPVAFRRRVGQSGADTVLMMDVLEHVDDEGALLRPYVDAVAPGTRFVVSVPAFQFLWSAHDIFLEHRRRYTLRALVKQVEASGLESLSSFYYFAAVFPIAAATRLSERLIRAPSAPPKSQMRKLPPWANGLLHAMCAAELPLMRFNRLFGLTVFAVFRKP